MFIIYYSRRLQKFKYNILSSPNKTTNNISILILLSSVELLQSKFHLILFLSATLSQNSCSNLIKSFVEQAITALDTYTVVSFKEDCHSEPDKVPMHCLKCKSEIIACGGPIWSIESLQT